MSNAIEGFNRQLRKVTKSRTVFPSDDSLLKMLYAPFINALIAVSVFPFLALPLMITIFMRVSSNFQLF